MKYDAIVNQGIPIYERVPIPERLIPEDSRVEIDAKVYAGYFTNEKIPTMEELSQVRGRAWYVSYSVLFPPSGQNLRHLHYKKHLFSQSLLKRNSFTSGQ